MTETLNCVHLSPPLPPEPPCLQQNASFCCQAPLLGVCPEPVLANDDDDFTYSFSFLNSTKTMAPKTEAFFLRARTLWASTR
eukprot:COSAG06_NODE_784_length_12328_cov_4.921416_17_plen_82_part_00